MSDAPPPAAPEWVIKRDGQLVPFATDKISQSLFAAAEALDRPDAFLSRELADSVVHFLIHEISEPVPTTRQVAEVVEKVVRELGHPALAKAHAEFTARKYQEGEIPSRSARLERKAATPQEIAFRVPADMPPTEGLHDCGRHFTLHAIYTRDLVSLHEGGLLTLGGLHRPLEMAALPLELHRASDLDDGLFFQLDQARRAGVTTLVLDGPENLLAPAWPATKPFAPGFARRLTNGLKLASLNAVVNLNVAAPPPWADESPSGPLFKGKKTSTTGLREDQADALAREWATLAAPQVQVDWHVGERDFQPGSVAQERLLQRIEECLRGSNQGFVFDRTHRPVTLAPGMTRKRQAVLLNVGLNLPRLADATGTLNEPEKFVKKLESLTRLALSAGAQKREYLRRWHRGMLTTGFDLARGFVLDRAIVMVVPIGLDHLIQTMVGQSMTHGGQALEQARKIVQRIRDVSREGPRNSSPEALVDGPGSGQFEEVSVPPSAPAIAGLTPWDPSAVLANQVRAASVLHGAVEAGTLIEPIGDDGHGQPQEHLAALQHIWEKTEIVRLRFLRLAARQAALPFGE